MRPGKDRICLAGVAVFIDCNSPLLPWDKFTGLPKTISLSLGETLSATIPLLTSLESALGVDVCGQLEVKFVNLPSFCTLHGENLTCTPKLQEHWGMHKFYVMQVALEHPLSTKTTPVTIEVVGSLAPVRDEFVLGNNAPFFEAPIPASVEVTKTAEPSVWSLQLPKMLDQDPGDAISVTMSLGVASIFVDFDISASTLKILDLSEDVVQEGSFNLTVSVEDGRHSVSHTIVLTVLPFERKEQSSASASNSTDAAADEALAINASLKLHRSSIIVNNAKAAKLFDKRSKKPDPPKFFISKITQDGLMEFVFTKEIQTVPNLNMLTNGTIEVNAEMHPVLELDIEPGEDSEKEKLGFTWYAIS